MKPSKVVMIVGIVVLSAVVILCGMLYNSGQNSIDSLVTDYHNNTQAFDRTQVSTIVEQLPSKNEEDGDAGFNYNEYDPTQITSWIDACKVAHHLMYHAGLWYSTSDEATINGMLVEQDCSGYIGVAMYLFGKQGDMSAVTTNSIQGIVGLTNVGEPGLSDLQQGDILVYSNHIEVFDRVDGKDAVVYSWGSSQSAEGAYLEGVNDHTASDCSASVTTRSSAFQSEKPTVYRFEGSTQPEPPPEPTPPPTKPEKPPIVGIPPATGTKELNFPLLVNQHDSAFNGVNLGTSSKSVTKVGCFASSIQMCANYLSSTSAWSSSQVASNFKLDYFTKGGGVNSSAYMSALTGGKYGMTGANSNPSIETVQGYIDAGIPVIMHFTAITEPYYTSGSGTHFVVIYGYNDSDFLVHDPSNFKLKQIKKSDACTKSSIEFRFITK